MCHLQGADDDGDHVELIVNGQKRITNAPGDTPLLWVLREDFGLTGTKYGCGIGMCGACSVRIDGMVVRSCSFGVENVSGPIETIEHIAENDGEPVISAWEELDVPQCGYCQPGMIVAATALLREKKDLDEADIKEAITNICRCGTYSRIVKAVLKASENV